MDDERTATDLAAAVLGRDVTIAYQPVVRLRDGTLTGFEALLRWRHPDRGPIAAAEFIDVAERTGFIVPMGRWVLREACQRGRNWSEAYPTSGLRMSINVSRRQLEEPDFVDQVWAALHDTGFPARRLALEVPEAVLLTGGPAVQDRLRAVVALGVTLTVDDFGSTGPSLSMSVSLAELRRRLGVTELKLAASVAAAAVAGTTGGDDAKAAVRAARGAYMPVGAKVVETAEQCDELRRAGCSHAQGRYLSPPLDAAAAGDLVRSTSTAGLRVGAPPLRHFPIIVTCESADPHRGSDELALCGRS